MMTLGEKIYSLRKNNSKELSHEKLAFELDISKTALIKWEQNKSMPSLQNLLKICNFFEIDFYSLIQDVASFNFYFDKCKLYQKELNFKIHDNNNLIFIENIINNQKNILESIQKQNSLLNDLLHKK